MVVTLYSIYIIISFVSLILYISICEQTISSPAFFLYAVDEAGVRRVVVEDPSVLESILNIYLL